MPCFWELSDNPEISDNAESPRNGPKASPLDSPRKIVKNEYTHAILWRRSKKAYTLSLGAHMIYNCSARINCSAKLWCARKKKRTLNNYSARNNCSAKIRMTKFMRLRFLLLFCVRLRFWNCSSCTYAFWNCSFKFRTLNSWSGLSPTHDKKSARTKSVFALHLTHDVTKSVYARA